jgi:hypothetical protein
MSEIEIKKFRIIEKFINFFFPCEHTIEYFEDHYFVRVNSDCFPQYDPYSFNCNYRIGGEIIDFQSVYYAMNGFPFHNKIYIYNGAKNKVMLRPNLDKGIMSGIKSDETFGRYLSHLSEEVSRIHSRNYFF